MAFADEQGRDEDARRKNLGQDFADLRFLFPERLADTGENLPAAQFCGVLIDRRGGIGILLRAMSQHHQPGIGKVLSAHPKGLTQEPAVRKPPIRRPSGWEFRVYAVPLPDRRGRLKTELQTGYGLRKLVFARDIFCLKPSGVSGVLSSGCS